MEGRGTWRSEGRAMIKIKLFVQTIVSEAFVLIVDHESSLWTSPPSMESERRRLMTLPPP